MSIYTNKVALITGGSRRLGKEIAKVIAECNYDIVLNYFKTPSEVVKSTIEELSENSVEVIPYKADFSKEDEIKRIYYYISDRFKRLDLVVNNAAIFRKVDFFDINSSIIDEFYNTNLKSIVISTIEAAKIMLKNDEKPCKIINIASIGGIQNWTNFIPYSLSKAGVIKFTFLSAKRLAPDILVNCISPATIDMKDEKLELDDISTYPMKRYSKVDDIKSLIKFLVLENKYITGHNFIVDGGKTL